MKPTTSLGTRLSLQRSLSNLDLILLGIGDWGLGPIPNPQLHQPTIITVKQWVIPTEISNDMCPTPMSSPRARPGKTATCTNRPTTRWAPNLWLTKQRTSLDPLATNRNFDPINTKPSTARNPFDAVKSNGSSFGKFDGFNLFRTSYTEMSKKEPIIKNPHFIPKASLFVPGIRSENMFGRNFTRLASESMQNFDLRKEHGILQKPDRRFIFNEK